jgi:hypothetical protein
MAISSPGAIFPETRWLLIIFSAKFIPIFLTPSRRGAFAVAEKTGSSKNLKISKKINWRGKSIRKLRGIIANTKIVVKKFGPIDIFADTI